MSKASAIFLVNLLLKAGEQYVRKIFRKALASKLKSRLLRIDTEFLEIQKYVILSPVKKHFRGDWERSKGNFYVLSFSRR